jgi:hypothetical protein
MNYAVVYLVAILLFSTLYWVIRGKKYYTGPRLEVQVNESDSEDRNTNEEFDLKLMNT